MSFRDLKLSPALCRTVEACGYITPTPVQAQSIPAILAGNDLLAAAQTGTGKTAAFALPILQILDARRDGRALASRPRVLVLTPTRELAMQVQESFRRYGKGSPARSLAVFGGTGMVPQTQSLRRGVDIVVATPGRLLDHMAQGNVDLSKVEILVLDEADRMLDMGFLPDLERILRTLPEQRQSLLFSATFPKEIRDLASRLLRDPVEVQVARPNSAAPQVSHALHMVEREEKKDLLVDLLSHGSDRQALVFCRTRHGSDRLCRQLLRAGFAAAAIHGDKSQTARTRALGEFKSGRTSVLVATDVAARGLDIRQLPLVVNYDLPQVPEDYIHRIGRTGRAGEVGRAVSLVSRSERELLHGIERLLDRSIEVAGRPPRATALSPNMEGAVVDLAPIGPARIVNRPARSGESHGSSKANHRPREERTSANRHAGRANGGRSSNGRTGTRPAHRVEEPRRDSRDARRSSNSSARSHESHHNARHAESRHTESRRTESRPNQPRRAESVCPESRRTAPPRTESRPNQPRRAESGGSESRGTDPRRTESRPTQQRRAEPRRRSRHVEPQRSQPLSGARFSTGRTERGKGRREGRVHFVGVEQTAASKRGSDRRDHPPRADRHPRKNTQPVTRNVRSSKGRPFWWPFAGKRRPDEVAPSRTGDKRRSRAHRDRWSESGEQA